MILKHPLRAIIVLPVFITLIGGLALAQDETGRDLRKKKPAAKPTPKPLPRPTPTPAVPAGATLTITAPTGAMIELDGRNRSLVGPSGTLVLATVATGDHELRVSADGYEPWSGTIGVRRPATSFAVPLKKKITTGRLTIFSNEPGTEVFLNEQPLSAKSLAGQPISMDGVKVGQIQLRAAKAGFKEWRQVKQLAPGESLTVRIELQPILDPEVVRVPAGEFVMGNDKGLKDGRPAHSVFVDEFEISRGEVTNRLYKRFIDATHRPAPHGIGVAAPYSWEGNTYHAGQDDRPVVLVSWEDAVAFCRWLSEQTGSRYRLPTEAEWEKAARTASAQYTSAGNVWEWCSDWYDPDFYKRRERTNPQGPPRGKEIKLEGRKGEMRVMRGGAFGRAALPIRAAERSYYLPSQGRFDLGFRVVREVKKETVGSRQ